MTKDPSLFKDRDDPSWPVGLYRRQYSFRFRRVVKTLSVLEVWGAIPEGDAIRRATRYNLDLEEGRNPIEERSKRVMTVAEFAREVWFPKKATQLRPRSLARYKTVTEQFIHYLEIVRGMRSALLSDIVYDVADDYLSYRESTPLVLSGQKRYTRAIPHGASKKTVLFDRETLFQLFKEAVRRDLIKKNPFEDIHPKKPTIHEVRAVHHPLTIEEEAALLVAAAKIDSTMPNSGNPKFYDIVLFLVQTGLRDDEMCNLEWTDIDLKGNSIQVRQKQVEATRTIPIPPSLVPALKKRLLGKLPSAPVFTDEDVDKFTGRLHIRNRAELLAIKVEEVDLDNLKIVARRSYTWKPKGTNGVVPMTKVVRSLLERLAENRTSNFVFPHRDGGPSRMDILSMLKKAQKITGIKGRLRIHDLRHTLGKRLRKDLGVPLETIMGILRHADIRETQIYAPNSPEDGQSAMSTLDAMSALNPPPKL